MKLSLLFLLFFVLDGAAFSQTEVGLEQYYFGGSHQQYNYLPMLHVQNSRHWYAEARYGYEAQNTISLCIGKTFSGGNKLTWSATPLMGGAAGRFLGASVGVNTELRYKKTSFSSQAQYSVSANNSNQSFIYSWSDISQQIYSWCYAGISLQHTCGTQFHKLETGILTGFDLGNCVIPIYIFSPYNNNRYIVVGLNLTWQHH
jgi:hypothetical protein